MTSYQLVSREMKKGGGGLREEEKTKGKDIITHVYENNVMIIKRPCIQ